MPDSPTGNRRHAIDSRNPSKNRASRIPTPISRNASRSSPTKSAAVASQESSINLRKTRDPPSVVRKPMMTQHYGESADIAPILQRQNPTRAVTTSSVPSSNRYSSYDVVVHQLMKPKDASPIPSALSESPARRTSAFITSPKSQSNQQASPKEDISGSVPLSSVRRHSARGRASSCLKDDCPPSLPPIHASPPFDPSLILHSNDGAGSDDNGRAQEKTIVRKSLIADVEIMPKHEEPPIHLVFDDLPTAYWTGRFISLHDHYMAEARDLPDPRDADGEDKMAMLELKRARHIFAVLYSFCKTPTAEASLKVRLLKHRDVVAKVLSMTQKFQRIYALRNRMPKLIDPHPSIATPKTVVRRSGETPHRRSLSNASTCAASIESAPSDYLEVENKKRNGLNRMTSSKSTTDSETSSLALSKTQSSSHKKSFLERLMGGTGEW